MSLSAPSPPDPLSSPTAHRLAPGLTPRDRRDRTCSEGVTERGALRLTLPRSGSRPGSGRRGCGAAARLGPSGEGLARPAEGSRGRPAGFGPGPGAGGPDACVCGRAGLARPGANPQDPSPAFSKCFPATRSVDFRHPWDCVSGKTGGVAPWRIKAAGVTETSRHRQRVPNRTRERINESF